MALHLIKNPSRTSTKSLGFFVFGKDQRGSRLPNSLVWTGLLDQALYAQHLLRPSKTMGRPQQ